MKQCEAGAQLLRQREALRAQRAAELSDAEAKARTCAVEFERPVMRALMQEKVSTRYRQMGSDTWSSSASRPLIKDTSSADVLCMPRTGFDGARMACMELST